MTDVQPETKFYAQFNEAPHGVVKDTLEIENIRQAVDYGFRNGMASFQTYEITTVSLDGEALEGKHKNFSGICYLLDKVLTSADIVAAYEDEIKQEKPRSPEAQAVLDSSFAPLAHQVAHLEDIKLLTSGLSAAELQEIDRASLNRSMRDLFKQDSAGKFFVKHPAYAGYVEIEPNDKVYNKQGHQIWPKLTAPAVKARPATGPRR